MSKDSFFPPGSMEDNLQKSFLEIFKVPKVTFDQPSAKQEQGCIFIEIEEAVPTIRDGREIYRVTGAGSMFAPNNKLPIGFFGKAIHEARPEVTRHFFFEDLEQNIKTFQNLVQRSFSFVYFFSGQYDPEIGNIQEFSITVEEH